MVDMSNVTRLLSRIERRAPSAAEHGNPLANMQSEQEHE